MLAVWIGQYGMKGLKARKYDDLAAKLISCNNSHEMYWATAARSLIAEGFKKFDSVFDYPKTGDLMHLLTQEDPKIFTEFFKDTPAANYVMGKGKLTDQLSTFRNYILNAMKPFLYLKNTDNGFSITNWVRDENIRDQKLFITTQSDDRHTIKPLYELWGNIALSAKKHPSQQNNFNNQVWYILDEVVAEGFQYSQLDTALAEIRKYVGSIIVGTQSIDQLKEVYGTMKANTFMDLFNTKVIFRLENPETISWASRFMGSEKVAEIQKNQTVGQADVRDNINIQNQMRTRPIISEDEFKSLERLQAYLKLPAIGQKTTIKLEYIVGEGNNEAFVEAELEKNELSSEYGNLFDSEENTEQAQPNVFPLFSTSKYYKQKNKWEDEPYIK